MDNPMGAVNFFDYVQPEDYNKIGLAKTEHEVFEDFGPSVFDDGFLDYPKDTKRALRRSKTAKVRQRIRRRIAGSSGIPYGMVTRRACQAAIEGNLYALYSRHLDSKSTHETTKCYTDKLAHSIKVCSSTYGQEKHQNRVADTEIMCRKKNQANKKELSNVRKEFIGTVNVPDDDRNVITSVYDRLSESERATVAAAAKILQIPVSALYKQATL